MSDLMLTYLLVGLLSFSRVYHHDYCRLFFSGKVSSKRRVLVGMVITDTSILIGLMYVAVIGWPLLMFPNISDSIYGET